MIWKDTRKSGYKKTKLGWIPEDWNISKLYTIAEINPEILSEDTPGDFEFYYIDLSTAREGVIKNHINKISFNDAPSRARKKIKKGDLLLSNVRPNLQGFVYLDFAGEDYVCSTGFSVIRTKMNADSHFVYYNLYSSFTGNYFNACVVGSSYPALNNLDVKNLIIPLPPLPEQKNRRNSKGFEEDLPGIG